MLISQVQVLIVEDMDAIRKIMAEQMRQLGFLQVFQAENGRRALELLEEHKIDLVLLDWSMPNGNGQELLKDMRQNERLSGTPVVLVTANTHRNMVQQAIKYGVSDIIAKPFTSKTLQARVLQALKQGRKSLFEQLSEVEENTDVDAVVPEKNTLLVVDDMPDNLAFLVGLLKDDYKVLFAKEGATALKICQSATPPDLVLLDIMMPEMDGHQVLKSMREHPQSDLIPVIFVTAMTGVEHQLQGLRGGAVDYITKPVQPEILKLRVSNLLATVNLQRNLQASYDNMLAMARLRDSVEEIINHDLKGPLIAISALAQKLAQDKNCPKEMSAKINMLDELAQQSINTVNLSAELLKIENGHFTLVAAPFSMHEMVKRLMNAMHVSFHFKQLVAYQVPDEDPNHEFDVLGDESLSYSMLLNLIKNAFEAAKARTKVAIYLTKMDGQVMIKIENSGQVPAEIRPRFWEKYVTQGKGDGTGLGTYSARLLARAQGGETRLMVNEAQDITCVEVRLPAA